MKKYVIEIGDKEYQAELKEFTKDYADIEVNGTTYHVKLKQLGRVGAVMPEFRPAAASARPAAPTVPREKPAAAPPRPAAGHGGGSEGVRAPMPGLILDVMAQEGSPVKAGQNVVLMEAMKMENLVAAPHDGTIHKIHVKKGDTVDEDQLLIEISRSGITSI